jgi:drug/metabolite transporter (DMT)-like permease
LPDEPHKPRRWTVIASGLLCGLLGLVVIFTNRGAFNSLLAVVIVAAIGLTAVLLQLRLRNREKTRAVHPPVWLNVVGIVFALAAVFADFLRLSPEATQVTALGAVGCFAVSGAIILHAFRKDRVASK